MRKCLTLIAMMLSLASFAGTSIPDWDKPLAKKVLITNPGISYVLEWVSSGNLVIDIVLDDWTDDREWKAVVPTITYKRIGWTFQWVTMLYEVIVPPNTIAYSEYFPLSYNQTFVFDQPGSSFVDHSQYYVSSWGPL